MALSRHRARAVPLGRARASLDRLYQDFDDPASAADPVHLVRGYTTRDDIEIVGFCAAGLAFGRVASVLASVRALLNIMGDSPSEFVRAFGPGRGVEAVRQLGHRWITGDDLVALLWILRHMLDDAGSLEAFFLRGYRADAEDIGGALDDFCTRARAVPLEQVSRPGGGQSRVGYFFPRPRDGSACKRLNLYLRWMVRHDRIDLGAWTGVDRAQLVVPLDTHVIRVGRCLRLTRYQTPGWPMAREITQGLRRLDPHDPAKYDFSLCHIGMQNACGFNQPQRDERCPLRGVCRPRPHTPRRSRRPSGRR